MIYKLGDIVVIPFPFVDNINAKLRPAVILSNEEFNRVHMHSLMAMITTGAQTKWTSDVSISDIETAGLNTPSLIRFKLFTLDNRLIKKKIGKLSEFDRTALYKYIKTVFEF